MRTQASLILPAISELDTLREQVDPEFAALVPAHVTLVYDDEAPDSGLLMHRLEGACPKVPTIELSFQMVRAFLPPDDGLYVETQATRGYLELREAVLAPPFKARGHVVPHVTILHPRRIAHAKGDWRTLAGTPIAKKATISRVSLLLWDGKIWRLGSEFALKTVRQS